MHNRIFKTLLMATVSSSVFAAIDVSDSNTYFTFTTSVTITDGLNPTTHEPLASSDWTVEESNVFQSNCNGLDASGSEHIYDDGDNISIYHNYLAPATVDCSTASHPNDPTNLIAWSNLGLVQKSEFGTETLTCGQGITCDIDQNVYIQDKAFDTVYPTSGVSASDAGSAHVFTLKINNYSYSNQRGIGGNGGSQDLPVYSPQTRYCIDFRDVSTHGAGSIYAKDPILNMFVYTWYPIHTGAPGSSGTTPSTTQKKIETYEFIDHSMRFWINKDNITTGF